MPDLYGEITEVDPEILEIMINVLEVRAADPQQAAMRERYFSWMEIEPDACILEGGCGTGAVARHLARIARSGEVMGLDPSPRFIEKGKGTGRRHLQPAVQGRRCSLPSLRGRFFRYCDFPYMSMSRTRSRESHRRSA